MRNQPVTFKFKVMRYFVWPSISPYAFVLSERYWGLVPHNRGHDGDIIIKLLISTVDIQIQGHALFSVA